MPNLPDHHPLTKRAYFFDRGIQFECTGCGRCCVGEPGIVRVTEPEVAVMAAFLGMPAEAVKTNHLEPYKSGLTIKEREDGACVFYENGCRIYPARPGQCRSFPFWVSVFRSKDRFDRTQKNCPGIGRGRWYARDEILDLLFV